MSVSVEPGRTFFDNSGRVLNAGTVTFYVAGSVVTKKAIYPTAADQAALTNALSNPQTLNSAGRLNQQVHGDGPYRMIVKDATGATILDEDITLTTDYSALSAATIGGALYPRTQAEIDAGITPSNTGYPAGMPERYAAAADGTTDDSVAVQAAFTVSPIDRAVLSAKTYLVSNVTIPSGAVIRSDGATLKFKSGVTGNMASISSASAVRIEGHLTLDGQDTTTYVVGSTAGNRTGLRITSSSNVEIDRLTTKGFNNRGVLIDNLNYSDHGTGVTIGHLTSYTNYCGLDFDTRGEYSKVLGCTLRLSRIGLRINAGNNSVATGNITDNVDGIHVLNGTNDGHGIATGLHVNHNSQYALYANGVTNGFTFNGCHWYYATIYLLNSNGINISNGQIAEATLNFEGGTKPSIISRNIINNNVVFNHGYNTTQSYVIVRDNYAIAGTVSTEFNRSDYAVASTEMTPAITADSTEKTVKFTSVGTKYFGCTNTLAYNSTTGVGTILLPGRYSFTVSLTLTNLTANVTQGQLYIRDIGGAVATSIYEGFRLKASAAGNVVTASGVIELVNAMTWDVRIVIPGGVDSATVTTTLPRLEVYRVA